MTAQSRLLARELALSARHTVGRKDRIPDRLRIQKLRIGRKLLMTEFIGVRVASAVFHVSYLLASPLAFALLVGVFVLLNYFTWERVALLIAALNLTFVPPALFSHPNWGAIRRTSCTGQSGRVVPWSVNVSPRRSVYFYAPAVVVTAIAAGTLMLPHGPIGFVNLAVQVLATVFMPAAMLLLLMLLNGRELIDELVNSPLHNALSIGVMGPLMVCNSLHNISTMSPNAL